MTIHLKMLEKQSCHPALEHFESSVEGLQSIYSECQNEVRREVLRSSHRTIAMQR